jgi:4-hydroxy-2-oxoheptanedioate aldolase
MIETKTAIERLDDILSVPGIDAVYVGPADLSLTLGLPPAMDHDDETFQRSRIAVADACRTHGIVAGIHASAALAPKHVEAGYQMITISSDVGHIAAGSARDLGSLREIGTSGQPVYR